MSIIIEAQDDEFRLSSGREVYANKNIIGIAPDGQTYTGYDDEMYADDFTPAERRELAEYVIGKWKAWAGLE